MCLRQPFRKIFPASFESTFLSPVLLLPYFHDSRLFRVRVSWGGFYPVITVLLCLKPFLGYHQAFGSLVGWPPPVFFPGQWGGFAQNPPPALRSTARNRAVVGLESQQVVL